jgi:hypothetical protein
VRTSPVARSWLLAARPDRPKIGPAAVSRGPPGRKDGMEKQALLVALFVGGILLAETARFVGRILFGLLAGLRLCIWRSALVRSSSGGGSGRPS